MRRTVSNSAADKAGETLRLFATADRSVSQDDAVAAYRTVNAYRNMHGYPLKKATISVGSFIKTVTKDESLRPGQRFKRQDRIIDKLLRFPKMRLSQMEDIGGVRAVLNDLEQVYGVAERILQRWSDVKAVDHIENPKPSGYRGLHLIARRDLRLIEIQLRTTWQDSWAVAVETWAPPAVPFNLKDAPNTCPDAVREYFIKASELVGRMEHGEIVSATLRTELTRLEGALKPWTGN